MKRKPLGLMGISIIGVLIFLMVVLPVSGAGKTGPLDGSGNQFGGQAYSCNNGQIGNGTGLLDTCFHHSRSVQYGNGQKNGRCGHSSVMGHNSGSGCKGCGNCPN